MKLPYLDEWNKKRRLLAHRYNQLLAGIPGVITPAEGPYGHIYHQYTIRITGGKRDRVKQALAEAGIGSMIYYPVPLHRLPV